MSTTMGALSGHVLVVYKDNVARVMILEFYNDVVTRVMTLERLQ